MSGKGEASNNINEKKATTTMTTESNKTVSLVFYVTQDFHDVFIKNNSVLQDYNAARTPIPENVQRIHDLAKNIGHLNLNLVSQMQYHVVDKNMWKQLPDGNMSITLSMPSHVEYMDLKWPGHILKPFFVTTVRVVRTLDDDPIPSKRILQQRSSGSKGPQQNIVHNICDVFEGGFIRLDNNEVLLPREIQNCLRRCKTPQDPAYIHHGLLNYALTFGNCDLIPGMEDDTIRLIDKMYDLRDKKDTESLARLNHIEEKFFSKLKSQLNRQHRPFLELTPKIDDCNYEYRRTREYRKDGLGLLGLIRSDWIFNSYELEVENKKGEEGRDKDDEKKQQFVPDDAKSYGSGGGGGSPSHGLKKGLRCVTITITKEAHQKLYSIDEPTPIEDKSY